MLWKLGMSVCLLSSSSLSLTSKAQEWRDGPGEGSPIVNLPFQMDRKGEGKKRKGDNGFHCICRARCIALEKIDLSEQI